MSFEVFEKLELKIQQAIDTITLLQMEIDELKEKNQSLASDLEAAITSRQTLEQENSVLKQEQQGWQQRLQTLLGRMDELK